MICALFVSALMAITTGLTAIAINSEWYVMLDYGLAATYNLLYNTYPYCAAALSVAELLTLLLNQTGTRRSGLENYFFIVGGWLGLLAGYYRFQRIKAKNE